MACSGFDKRIRSMFWVGPGMAGHLGRLQVYQLLVRRRRTFYGACLVAFIHLSCVDSSVLSKKHSIGAQFRVYVVGQVTALFLKDMGAEVQSWLGSDLMGLRH